MIRPALPPEPRDPLMTLFIVGVKAMFLLILIAVAGLVVAIVVDAHRSPNVPTVSAFENRR